MARVLLLSALLVSLSYSRGLLSQGHVKGTCSAAWGPAAQSVSGCGDCACARRGGEGEECHPFSHKVPFFGKRQHHTCPCLPHLACTRYAGSKYRCTSDFKNIDF